MIIQNREPIEAKSIFLILFAEVIGFVLGTALTVLGAAMGLGAFAVIIGLVLMVLGIVYPFIKLSQMVRDINIMCEGDGEHLMHYVAAWLLGFITLGIYYIYYLYRIQNRLHENCDRYNVKVSEKGGTIVLWFLLGFLLIGIGPFVSLAIVIKNFNKMAYGYNEYLGCNNDISVLDDSLLGDVNNSDPTVAREGLLRCVEGPLKGASIVIRDRETVIIGREAKESNLIISDSKISRKHCSVTYDADRNVFVLTDFSSNGTELANGTKLIKGEPTTVNCNTEFVLAKRAYFVVMMKPGSGKH